MFRHQQKHLNLKVKKINSWFEVFSTLRIHRKLYNEFPQRENEIILKLPITLWPDAETYQSFVRIGRFCYHEIDLFQIYPEPLFKGPSRKVNVNFSSSF